jgi:hypothetical protein
VYRCDIEWFRLGASERVDLLSQTADESTRERRSIVVMDVECGRAYPLLESHDIDALCEPRGESTRLERVPRRTEYAGTAATFIKHPQRRVHKEAIIAALPELSGARLALPLGRCPNGGDLDGVRPITNAPYFGSTRSGIRGRVLRIGALQPRKFDGGRPNQRQQNHGNHREQESRFSRRATITANRSARRNP